VPAPRPAAGRQTRRRFGRLVTFTLTCVLVAILPTARAQAEPTVAELEAQIQAMWAEAEPLIEEYNGVHEQYKQNLARQAELVEEIEPLQRQLDLAQVRIGAIAAEAYKGSQVGQLNALLTSGSPEQLADQMELLDVVARDQQRQLADVNALKAEYDAQKAPIDELVTTLAEQDADLAARTKAIEERLAELQKLRRQAYGETGSTGSFRPWPCPATYEPTNGYRVASFACQQAGKPYLWAADGPGSYDCSGLSLAAWKQVGVYLPHQSRSQRASMPYISRADLRLGDIVYYYNPIHHLGIYVGDNKIMHAPSAGDYVRMADMDKAGPIHSYGRPG
jgi:cell wall-associated NlpC family hydrolase